MMPGRPLVLEPVAPQDRATLIRVMAPGGDLCGRVIQPCGLAPVSCFLTLIDHYQKDLEIWGASIMRRWAVPLAVLGLSHAAGAAELDYLRGSEGYEPGYQVVQTPAQEWNAAENGSAAVTPAPSARSCWVNDITRANQQVSVDFIDTQVWYGPEIINPSPPGFSPAGVPLDGEKGWLPGLRATGSYMEEMGPICNTYVSASFSWANGHTNYWASGGPTLSNVDGATVENTDFRLGQGFSIGPNWMITPYLGGGSRWWDRLLTGPFGYNEVYKHEYAGVGLLVQYSPAPGWVLSANGLVEVRLMRAK